MTDYKLVPLPPTPEMVSAAEDAYMPFGDMELAIRMALLAAPAVQGEPVAWNDPAVAPDGFVLMPRDLTNEMVRAFCMATVLRWDDAPEDQKIEVAKKLQHAFDAVIAAAPQPADQQPYPEGIREGAPYDDPAFSALCREHDIWGTAAAAQCAVFWEAGKRVAEQQPATDVEALVEALEAMLAVRVIEADASYGLACAKAEQALAAWRQSNEEK